MRFFILLLALTSILPSTQAFSLPDGVSVLTGTDPSFPNEDLAPLDPILASSKILGLGESAHGVADYQKMQFRIAKYAIENFGYRRILAEGVSDSRSINAFLKNCRKGERTPL